MACGRQPLENAVVLIDGERIAAVQAGEIDAARRRRK